MEEKTYEKVDQHTIKEIVVAEPVSKTFELSKVKVQKTQLANRRVREIRVHDARIAEIDAQIATLDSIIQKCTEMGIVERESQAVPDIAAE